MTLYCKQCEMGVGTTNSKAMKSWIKEWKKKHKGHKGVIIS